MCISCRGENLRVLRFKSLWTFLKLYLDVAVITAIISNVNLARFEKLEKSPDHCCNYSGPFMTHYAIFAWILSKLWNKIRPCINTATWHCRNLFTQWQRRFQWERSHWLEVLPQRHIAIVIQGPGPSLLDRAQVISIQYESVHLMIYFVQCYFRDDCCPGTFPSLKSSHCNSFEDRSTGARSSNELQRLDY